MLGKTDKRIYNINERTGIATGGKIPDARYVVDRAVAEATEYETGYDVAISGKNLADRVSLFVHTHTLYHNYRPLGVSIIFGTHDSTGFNLFMIKPSGHCFVRNYHTTNS